MKLYKVWILESVLLTRVNTFLRLMYRLACVFIILLCKSPYIKYYVSYDYGIKRADMNT